MASNHPIAMHRQALAARSSPARPVRRSMASIMAIIFAAQLLLPQSGMTQALTPESYPASSNINSAPPPAATSPQAAMIGTASNPVNLDLSAQSTLYAAPVELPVNIQYGGQIGQGGLVTGGTPTTITPQQLLTPAQLLAVMQVVSTGQQSIQLNGAGHAEAGSSTLTPSNANYLSNLVVPANVALALVGYNNEAPLNVTGNTSVQGALFALQTAPGVSSVLNFSSLNISSGGLISGYLPASTTVLASTTNFLPSSGLTINVATDLINNGVVTAPGTLSISAGQSIVNQSLNSVQAVISAQQLNLYSALGNIVNSGLMQATGAINVTTLAVQHLEINNLAGVIQSTLGAINVRDALACATGNSSITGGDLLSSEVNAHGGNGSVRILSDNIAGTINVSGSGIRLDAHDLKLGSLYATGDPLITASGTVTFTAALQPTLVTNGAPLTIVAGQNIVDDSLGPYQIDTSSPTGNGGTILLVAGAAFNTTATELTITGPSLGVTGGGDITLNLSQLDSRGGTAAGTQNVSGGSIALIAYPRADNSSGGTITFPNTLTIQSGGDGLGNDGNVTIVGARDFAGATTLTLPNIDTTGGGGTAADILIATATPQIVGTEVVINNVAGPTEGAIISGSLAANTTAIQNGSVRIGSLITNGGDISVMAGENLIMFLELQDNFVDASRKIGDGNGGNILILAGASSSSSQGNLDFRQTINSNALGDGDAGNINVVTRGTMGVTNIQLISANGDDTGAAGHILLAAGITYALSATQLTFGGQSLQGGNIELTAPTPSVTAHGGASDGDGGDITLLALQGTAHTPTSGFVHTQSDVFSGGNGTGTNGDVVIVSNNDTIASRSIFLNGDLSTRGGSGGGGTIHIGTTNPVASGGPVSLDLNSGDYSFGSGRFDFDPTQPTNSGIEARDLLTDGREIQVLSGRDIATDQDVNSSRSSNTGDGGSILMVAGLAVASTVGLIRLDAVRAEGGSTGTNNGGNINLIARGDISTTHVISDGANLGDAGNILEAAGVISSINSGTVTIGSESVSGGRVTFTFGSNVSSQGSGVNGGNIALVAYEGTTGSVSSGKVDSAGGGPNLLAAGSDNSDNVAVTIIAGDNDGGSDAISIGTVSTAGGLNSVGGTVRIGTTTPRVVGGTNVAIDQVTGKYTISSGRFDIDTSFIQGTNSTLQAITTNGTEVAVRGGGDVTVASASTSRTAGNGNAGNIIISNGRGFTGSITVGTLSANALGATFSSGNIQVHNQATGSITLNGNISTIGKPGAGFVGISGGSIPNGILDLTVNSIDIYATEFVLLSTRQNLVIHSASNHITSSNNNVTLLSNSTITADDSLSVTAFTDVFIAAPGAITIGNTPLTGGTGVTINAGLLIAEVENQFNLLGPNTVVSNGQVLILSLNNPTSNVSIGDNSSITARGGGGAGFTPPQGLLQIFADGNLATGDSVSLTAWGGLLVLVADAHGTNPTSSITLGPNTAVRSIGKINDTAGSFSTNSTPPAALPNYVGGRIGIYAGVDVFTNPNYIYDDLDTLVNSRGFVDAQTIVGAAFDLQSPNYVHQGGTQLQILTSTAQTLSVDTASGNSYSLQGGVISIDPVTNLITFNGINLLSVGPEIFLTTPTVSCCTTTTTATAPPHPQISISTSNDTRLNALIATDLTPPDVAILPYFVPFCQPRQISTSNRPLTDSDKQCERWLVSAGPCQPFVFKQGDGLYIIGVTGTSMAPTARGPRSLTLSDGKLLLLATGNDGCVIETTFGELTVPGSSASLIEQISDHSSVKLQITSIAGNQLQFKPKHPVAASIIDIQPETELSFDGTNDSRAALPRLSSSKINIKDFMKDDQTFSCVYNCSTLTSRRDLRDIKDFIEKRWGAHNRISQTERLAPTSPKAGEFKSPPMSLTLQESSESPTEPQSIALAERGEHFLLVQFKGSNQQNNKQNSEVQKWMTSSAEIRYFDAADLMLNQKEQILLGEGEILVYGLKALTVKAHGCTIVIEPNAMALISQEGDTTKVRNLYDRSSNSIHAQIGGRMVSLTSGQEAVLLGKLTPTSKVIADQVGRRKSERFDLPEGHSILRSEVSLVSLMVGSPLLRRIVNSPDKDNRALSERMFHMAACLHMVSSHRGPFVTANASK